MSEALSQIYHVIHETIYTYAAPVSLSQHLLHQTPRNWDFQRVLAHQIEIEPAPAEREDYPDWFGNPSIWLALREAHASLRLISASTVEVMTRPQGWRKQAGPPWESVAALLAAFPSSAPLDAQEFALASPQVPLLEELRQWARISFTPGRPLLEAARDLMGRIHGEFRFDPKASTVSTPVIETFRKRAGVCQDFSQLMICALRSLGLAARYMSGYILTHPAPGKPRLIGADASHAWLALWCPESGWVGFDPTNNLQPDLEHVVLGWGRDFADVTPMRGVILGGASHDVDVRVTMMPAQGRSLAQLLAEVRATPVATEAKPAEPSA